jgi:hypothetical protein
MRRGLPWLLLVSATAWACSVPVFRYALERWPADSYVAVVYHQGGLSPEQAACVRELGREGEAGRTAANVTVRVVDTAKAADPSWRHAGTPLPSGAELPALRLLYPPAERILAPAWQGPLTPRHVSAVLGSPARRELARRLLRGDTAVWLFVTSGETQLDATADQILAARLKHLEVNLRLPELDPTDVRAESGAAAAEKLAVRFSVLRISRTDPAEMVLVGMLMNSEEDLLTAQQPVAFPVFGRGRMLYALVGPGINDGMIDEACGFITGACSCVVKEENPGTDLLLGVDWAALVEPMIKNDEAPPLAGVAEFAASRSSGAAAREWGVAGRAAEVSRSPRLADSTGSGGGVASNLIRRLGFIGALAASGLMAATWWLGRQRGG